MQTNQLHKITWQDSIWFSDVDDTLINTAKNTEVASEGVELVFTARFGKEIGKKIKKNFIEVFHTMMAGLRNKTEDDWSTSAIKKEEFDNLWEKIEKYQQEIKEKYGTVKKFSREIFIQIAADRANLQISPELLYEAADAYWVTLSEKTELLPGVKNLTDIIKQHGRPLYLITSSDARLKLKSNGQFEYIPEYSESFKRERMQLLRNKGLEFNIVSIGDPEDKPHLDFFKKGINLAEKDFGSPIILKNAIFMGDSFTADLQTPKEQLGFGLVVLCQEEKAIVEIIDEHQITTNNLEKIIPYFL
ncbi:MAG TPA: hypothetical protein VNW29_04260 [Candidatus Sulfotelmatobacter sp.]|jgi:FMN phosphatase YigB (HAD superfamily)|nr:hypothetical protein [Candidatus Sulfotelmatobacter sp.]